METKEAPMQLKLNVQVTVYQPHQLQEVQEQLRQHRYQYHQQQLRIAQKAAIAKTKLKCGGKHALHLAAEKGRLDLVKKLIEMGTNVDIKDNNGWTPLMYASSMGHLQVVVLLVLSNASIHQLDKDGFSAVIRASEKGHFDVVDYLTHRNKKRENSDE